MQNWRVETRLSGSASHFELRRYQWPLNHVRVHQEPEAILGMVIGEFTGEARPRTSGSSAAFRKLGRLIFSPAAASYDMKGSGGEQVVATIRFAPHLITDLMRDLDWNERRLAACMDVQGTAIDRSLMAVAREARFPGFGSDVMLEAAGAMMAVELARFLRGQAKQEAQQDRRFSRWQLDRIHDMIAANPMVGLDAIAGECAISVRTLTRVYRATTGRTIGHAAGEARITAAMRLLADETIPLKLVAHRVGFANPSCFTSAFKRARGVTPGAFRAACHGSA